MQNQILETRYIERSQLLKLLRQLFGNDFLVEDRPDYYVLTVPRRLNEVRALQLPKKLISKILGRIRINYNVTRSKIIERESLKVDVHYELTARVRRRHQPSRIRLYSSCR